MIESYVSPCSQQSNDSGLQGRINVNHEDNSQTCLLGAKLLLQLLSRAWITPPKQSHHLACAMFVTA